MSEYPVPPAYGAGYGSRDQNNNPYAPPYSNPYMQGDGAAQSHIGANYDASMSAYGYNQSVPGFPTPNVATGAPPIPIYQGWNQESHSLHSYSTPPNPTPYQGYVQNTQAQQSAQYYPSVSQPNYQQSIASVQRYEQADLSEGEFEDGIAPQIPNNYSGSQWGPVSGNGYANTAQRAFQNRNQGYNSQPALHTGNNHPPRSRENSQLRRQQSDSYSPYAADEQPRSKSTAPTQAKKPLAEAARLKNSETQNGTKNQTNGHQTNGWHKAQEENNHAVQPAFPTIAQNATSQSAVLKGRNIPEMRMEAGKAIRELFPRGVRYSTYLEEGFKEDIISNLFDDVKMPKTPVVHGKNDLEYTVSARTNSNLPDDTKQDASTTLGNKSVAVNGAAISEAAVAPAKSVAMDEKQKTLQSKMEALRKSREERAQKAAAKNPVKPVTVSEPVPTSSAPSTLTSSVAVSDRGSRPEEASTAPASKSPPTLDNGVFTPPLDTSKVSLAHPLPTTVNTQPQLPLIPGLFLASNAATPAPIPIPTPPPIVQAPIANQRKRPVASDFDEPTTAIAVYKRPFGHSRNEQPLVINVSEDESEDEDEDVAMELESQADQDSPVIPGRKMSDPRSTSFQNLQSNNTPLRKPFTPPPNAIGINTPPRPQSASKTPLPTPDVLLQKETEIQKLKKMIAEREAARARARQTPSGSGSHTPRGSETEATASRDTSSSINSTSASKVEASIQVQKMITVADEKVALDQQRLLDAQAAEAKKAAEVTQKEAEQKRLRRQKIAADLPLVDAEVQRGQSKLEELRAEMARIEADMRQKMEDKRKLSEEMARLGQETDDQLQAQKDKLDDLNRQEASVDIGTSQPKSSTVAAEPNNSALNDQDMPLSVVEADVSKSPPVDIPADGEPKLPANLPVNDSNHVDESSIALSSSAIDEDRDDSNHSISTDRALEAQLQEAAQAQADRHDGENTMEIEIPAPESHQDKQRSASSPPEEGQISDDYSPILDRDMADTDAPDRESDDYEPPDATPPNDMSEVDSPPFSPAPPDPVPELHIDDMVIDSIQAANSSSQKNNPETKHHDNGVLLQVIENDIHQPPRTQFFTPYESPLKRFRAYRFHPEFKHDVAGGLRSLTYSHNIDPNAQFCRYELAGGICNDPNCAEQHFRSIKIPDDQIMAAIGCPDEFQGEQREKFRDSLKEVLLGLRVRKVKDFDTISTEIIAHRAKFLGDSSKILAALEGIAL